MDPDHARILQMKKKHKKIRLWKELDSVEILGIQKIKF